MHKYKVLSALALFSGVVLLDRRQAEARSHAVEHLGDDAYLVNARVEFKAGEVIGFEGEPDKSVLAQLEPFDGTEEADAPKGKAKRKGKANPLPGPDPQPGSQPGDLGADLSGQQSSAPGSEQGGGQQNGGEQ